VGTDLCFRARAPVANEGSLWWRFSPPIAPRCFYVNGIGTPVLTYSLDPSILRLFLHSYNLTIWTFAGEFTNFMCAAFGPHRCGIQSDRGVVRIPAPHKSA
jgi:hypothetical protein